MLVWTKENFHSFYAALYNLVEQTHKTKGSHHVRKVQFLAVQDSSIALLLGAIVLIGMKYEL